jgi:DNA-binding response OmpR family regulator
MKKILVIADEQNTRSLYEEKLDGYQVTLSAAGEEAKLNGQDLIILDIKNPEEDGIEIMQNISDTPVIICSDQGHYKQDFRIWASSARVVKSADIRELKLTIKEIFNQRQTGGSK